MPHSQVIEIAKAIANNALGNDVALNPLWGTVIMKLIYERPLQCLFGPRLYDYYRNKAE